MDCPRCKLSLSLNDYEGQQVHFCGNCWGYWLTRQQLDTISHAGDYTFSDAEVAAVETAFAQHGDADRQGDESSAIACPECGGKLARHPYALGSPVEVDECRQHGVWLDTGEIKDLQVYVERNMRK